jgi:tetratricopeptide (TPR) repeat protein
LEKSPDDAGAHQGRGLARQGKDDLDGAIDDLTEAIRLDSSMVRAYGVRGICYQRQGKHDRAIADLTKAIDLDGNYAEAIYRRGVSYANTGMRTAALADYEKAIAICKRYERKDIRYKQIHQDALEAIAIEKRTLGRNEEK